MSLDEGTFIENVESFVCIWNTKLKEHRNQLVVENAWKTVATIMEESVENCKEIWKSLRAKYIRERILIVTMPSGSAAYTGNWPLFKAMRFLAPVVQTRLTSGNVPKKVTSVQKPSQSWSTTISERDENFTEADGSLIQLEDRFGQVEANISHAETELNETLRPCLQMSQMEEVESHRDTDISSESSTSLLDRVRVETTSRREPITTKKRKLPDASLSVESLVKSCSDVGESLNLFLQQSTEDTRKIIKNEDHYFALSLAESLSKIQIDKKNLY